MQTKCYVLHDQIHLRNGRVVSELSTHHISDISFKINIHTDLAIVKKGLQSALRMIDIDVLSDQAILPSHISISNSERVSQFTTRLVV